MLQNKGVWTVKTPASSSLPADSQISCLALQCCAWDMGVEIYMIHRYLALPLQCCAWDVGVEIHIGQALFYGPCEARGYGSED